LAVLSIVLLVFSVMAGNISSLRRNLVSSRAMLKESLEKIKHISITDNLTGCYNRLYTSENLDREVSRSLRYKRSISLAMFDIDRFKSVNDTYGHQYVLFVIQLLLSLSSKTLPHVIDSARSHFCRCQIPKKNLTEYC